MDKHEYFEFFQLKSTFRFTPFTQISLIVILYVLTTLGCYFEAGTTGKMYGYPIGVSMLFVPIYEELIFRGILLKVFETRYGVLRAILLSSILFGLWHLKNIFWLDSSALIRQIAFTTLIFAPITAWLTIKTRTLWPAVIIHYLNNFPLEPWLNYLR
jgi:hypothetical protein